MVSPDLAVIKTTVDNILRVPTLITHKSTSVKSNNKKNFVTIVNGIDACIQRDQDMESVGINLFNYNTMFFNVIEGLLILGFKKEIYEVISFYLYNRFDDETGDLVPYHITKTKQIYFENAEILYDYLASKYPNFLK